MIDPPDATAHRLAWVRTRLLIERDLRDAAAQGFALITAGFASFAMLSGVAPAAELQALPQGFALGANALGVIVIVLAIEHYRRITAWVAADEYGDRPALQLPDERRPVLLAASAVSSGWSRSSRCCSIREARRPMATPDSHILNHSRPVHTLGTDLPMKIAQFLVITAIVEIGAGLALLFVPDVVIGWILGVAPAGPAPLFLARWLGVALLAIGVASGLAREASGGPARRGVAIAAVFYDVAVALLFVFSAVGSRMAGPVLWPAVGLHAVLSVWGLLCLAERADARVQRGAAR